MKLYNKIFILVFLLLFIPAVNAGDMCGDEITSSCTMLTPVLSCSEYNYSIYNITGSKIEENALIPLDDGVYQFTFNQSVGDYIVKLCDDTTREITVGGVESMGAWGLALIFGFVSVAIFFLYLGLKGDNRQLPLKLIFISGGLGFLLFALQTNILLVNANENFIDNITVFNDLVSVTNGAYVVMLYMFWIFVAITTLTVLFTAVNELKRRRR